MPEIIDSDFLITRNYGFLQITEFFDNSGNGLSPIIILKYFPKYEKPGHWAIESSFLNW